MNSLPSVVVQAAALGSHSVLPLLAPAVITPLRPVRAGRVVVAGGGRDLPGRPSRSPLPCWPAPVASSCMSCSMAGPVALIAPSAAPPVSWAGLLRVLPADWHRHGRAAGPIRNRELLELAISRAVALTSAAAPVAVLVVAFPGGAGTASLVQQARRMAASSPVPIAVAQISQAPALPDPSGTAASSARQSHRRPSHGCPHPHHHCSSGCSSS